MANEKEFKIRLVAEGGQAAAQEIAAVEQATEGVADAAGRAGRNAGAVAAVADGAPEAAQEINQVGEALEGTGLEALGLGDKLSGARARLEELKRASAEAAGPEGLGDLAGKAGEAKKGLGDLIEGGIDALGGPVALLTTALTTLAAAWAKHNAVLQESYDLARKTADQFKVAREEFEAMAPQIGAFRNQAGSGGLDPRSVAANQAQAESARRRQAEIANQLALLGNEDLEDESVMAGMGGREALNNLIAGVVNSMPSLMAELPAAVGGNRQDGSIDPNRIEDPVGMLRLLPAIRQAVVEELERRGKSAQRVADQAAAETGVGQKAIGEDPVATAAFDAELAARRVQQTGGSPQVVSALKNVAEILSDGLQGGELAQVTEIISALAQNTAAARAEDRAALDRLRSEVGQLASRVSANRSFTDD